MNRGFTPRQVAKIEESVRVQAREIVDRVAPMGECDFVSEIAAALPLQIICDMMGIPREDTKRIFELTNMILGVGDPEYVQTMEELMVGGHGAVPVRPRARRRPAGQPARRHHDRADAGGGRGRERRAPAHARASSGRSSCCSSWPATRRHATRSVTALLALTEHPDQRAALASRLRRRLRNRGRGDRALGDAGDPLPPHGDRATRSSAARRSRPARRS